ncbi:hypothetical protein M427DRAFT_27847 [Gonapodya prolifera JEL478]|uniref:Uncharacterized protein n=1 Tax=Gonapodya prolifera (strain JEL478) TaxID=1344416 RepID=A0A139AVG6_GONPJ|nr:hypothetical protein M427DRAFT_27847 [Gonapodya prolifera JEL478]|eukprot:KXS20731.1 hypothetical protein M427DRAFT_27847 [Gonapodya prolifera JEL478]
MPPKARKSRGKTSSGPPSLAALTRAGRSAPDSVSESRKSESNQTGKNKIDLAILGEHETQYEEDDDDVDSATPSNENELRLLAQLQTVLKKRKDNATKSLMETYDDSLNDVVDRMAESLGTIEQDVDSIAVAHKRRAEEIQDEVQAVFKKLRTAQEQYQSRVVHHFEQLESNATRLTRLRKSHDKEVDELRGRQRHEIETVMKRLVVDATNMKKKANRMSKDKDKPFETLKNTFMTLFDT